VAVTKHEFIGEAETAWDTTTPKETPSITVQKGDVVVAFADCEEVTEGKANLSNPTGGGLVWTLKRRNLVNQFNETAVWTATATEAKTFKVTFARGATSRRFGGNVLVYRKSAGVGASVQRTEASAAPSFNITTEKDHSAIVMAIGDWNAIDGKSRVYRTNAGAFTEQTYQFIAGVWTVYGGFHADAGVAGTYAVGLSAPAGQKYSLVAIEILGEEAKAEPVDLASALAGTASISGELRTIANVEAAITGSGSLSSELITVAGLAGVLSGAAALAGELRVLASIAADLPSTAALAAELAVLASLAARLEGQDGLSGEIAQSASLALELIGNSSLLANLDTGDKPLPFVDLPTELVLEGRETSMSIVGRAVALGLADNDTALTVAGGQTSLLIAGHNTRLTVAQPDSRLAVTDHNTELTLDG
jgi:hypothetical protein